MVGVKRMNDMDIFKRLKITIPGIFISVILILSYIVTVEGDEYEDTIVGITPLNQNVSPGNNFIVNVSCIPGQPIKSFEFRLSFNSSLLIANSITEGNIFNGYNTFFNNGTINNPAGTIVNIYGLIIGTGNVTNSGTFVTINFTAKELSLSGTSLLDIYDVGVTDETGYVSTILHDGNVTVLMENTDLSISTPNPVNSSTDIPIETSSVSISINAIDTFNYIIQTNPDIGNVSENNAGNGSKSCSISGLEYSTTYTWFVNATSDNSTVTKYYMFTTEAEDNGDDNHGGEGSGSIPPAVNDTIAQNNPPAAPVKPSGPKYAEIGIEYTYETYTFDVDGNQIRYRFDWGDETYSNWSEFVHSNVSISMKHSWASNLSYEVRVLAQDENGTNSSWSSSLEVNVSMTNESGEELPFTNVDVAYNLSVDDWITFNTSDFLDFDGTIVSYYWDFGDGTTGTGVNPTHTYNKSRQYNVTLIVTDSNGNTYSKIIIINVNYATSEKAKEKEQGVPLFGILVLGFASVTLACIAVFFRDDIILFLMRRHFNLFSHKKKIYFHKVANDSGEPSVLEKYRYLDEIQEDYTKIDSREIKSEEEKISHDDTHIRERIDKLQEIGLNSDMSYMKSSASSKVLDIGSMVDTFILSKIKNKTEDTIPKINKENIERKVDFLILSKEIGVANF